ncbi:MAG: DUF3592 domain-containing protein [Verrucomicrobiota bacterium]
MSDHTFLVVFALAAYLFAGVIGAGGIILRRRMRGPLKSAKGTINSIEGSVTMSSSALYPIDIPHVRFPDMNGVEHCVALSESTEPERYKIGDIVEVFYDPSAPQHVFIDPKCVKGMSHVCLYAASFAVLVATVIFILIMLRLV